MQALTTLLLLATASASALPSPNVNSRSTISATIYPEPNFQGEPTYLSDLPNNQCTAVPEGTVVGSFKVDSGALCRLTYNADTCSAHGDLFVFPDTPAEDLSGENVTHLLCQECSGC